MIPTDHIKRPQNSFMIWASETRPHIAKTKPYINNANISKILGQIWTQLPTNSKLNYKIKANNCKIEHKLKYPNYKYTPNKIKKLKISKIKVYEEPVKEIVEHEEEPVEQPEADDEKENCEPDYFGELQLFYANLIDL